MRGNLPNKEPEFLKRWEEMDLYRKVLEKNAGKPSYVLHDGPPYANGNIHIVIGMMHNVHAPEKRHLMLYPMHQPAAKKIHAEHTGYHNAPYGQA